MMPTQKLPEPVSRASARSCAAATGLLGVASGRRRCAGSRGTSAVEFALVVTPCLLLIFAIMNFATALYSLDFVGYSAQQAARYAIVHGSTSTSPASSTIITNYVDGLVLGVLNTNLLTVNTTWTPNNKPGSVVTVTVSYTFKPLTALVSSVNIALTRTAAMVISQ
jgi:Flp pilus assembly protein TadG